MHPVSFTCFPLSLRRDLRPRRRRPCQWPCGRPLPPPPQRVRGQRGPRVPQQAAERGGGGAGAAAAAVAAGGGDGAASFLTLPSKAVRKLQKPGALDEDRKLKTTAALTEDEQDDLGVTMQQLQELLKATVIANK